MQESFAKKVIRIALVLMLVSGLSAAIIIALNKLTAPIIVNNNIEKENNSLAQIYEGAEFELIEENVSDTILKVSLAKKDGNDLGYVYKITGKNGYGKITLLIGVTDGKVVKVVFLENTESYASTVEDHVNNTYKPNAVTVDNINDVDVKCGATFGAKTIKEMMQEALNHYNSNNGGGEE